MKYRYAGFFACLALAGTIRPAGAQLLGPAQAQAFACVSQHNARSYRQSLQNCTSAAAGYQRLTVTQRNPWYGFYMEARLLYVAALDSTVLRNRRKALQDALQAHQIALYVLRTYQVADGERNDLVTLTYALQRLEAGQQNGAVVVRF